MNVLFIAPLPPPLAGHSLAAKTFYEYLATKHHVTEVDFNKKSFKEGISDFGRIFEVLGVQWKIAKNVHRSDVIYITISESYAGNVKDILTYILSFRKLSKLYIHLHGGSIKRQLWDNHPFLYKINKYFIKRTAGVIISGNSHRVVFDQIVDESKIHSIPNFALDYLFIETTQIDHKFKDINPIRVLYMSNMIDKKGYEQLALAYISLPKIYQEQILIDFAGRFEFDTQKQEFENKINGYSGLSYHGVVEDAKKKELFFQSHVFALPTSYFEGQPISILEAYAAGCAVITTGQSGILDIFADGKNGIQIENGMADAIRDTLIKMVDQKESLYSIALFNAEEARARYRIPTYCKALTRVLELSNSH